METTTAFWNEADMEVSHLIDCLSDDVNELKHWVDEYDHGEKKDSILNAECLSRKLNSCAGNVKFLYFVLNSELTEVGSSFFYGH